MHPRSIPDPSESAPESAPLAAGLSDMALGGGGGVWRWREMEEDDGNAFTPIAATGGRGIDGPSRRNDGGARLPPHWMESVWMQRVCLHAVCLTEPDADSEAWDAISAISIDATPSGALELRATRDIEAGVEVLGDYGPLSAAECLRLPLSGSDCLLFL
jgi:hypothetical protein